MKKISLLVVLLIMASLAQAAVIQTNDIKVYVNNEKIDTADTDGGYVRVYPSDEVEVKFELKNNASNQTHAKVKGIMQGVDQDDDIIKSIEFDIDSGGTTTRTLTFGIPDDAEQGDYDFQALVYEMVNDTTTVKDVMYDLRIRGESTTTSTTLTTEHFNNMTQVCNSVISAMTPLYSYLNDSLKCNNELSTVKEERGTFKQDSEDCNERLSVAVEEKSTCLETTVPNLNQQVSQLKNEKSAMIDSAQCNQITTDKVKEEVAKAKDGNFKMIFFVLAAGGVLWWWNTNKDKKKTVEDKTYMVRR